MDFTPEDFEDLKHARSLLESYGFAQKVAMLLGMPIEKAIRLLPRKWQNAVNSTTRDALQKALVFAVQTMQKKSADSSRKAVLSTERFHKLLVTASGAGGGALGTAGPRCGTAFLHNRYPPLHCRHCQERRRRHFGPGNPVGLYGGLCPRRGPPSWTMPPDTGYFAVRGALAKSVSGAMKHIAQKGVVEKTAPALVRFISVVAARFGILVSDKVAAQAVPVIGAAGGAGINALFIDHFQSIARGHFIIRRLERTYGQPAVREAYEALEDE